MYKIVSCTGSSEKFKDLKSIFVCPKSFKIASEFNKSSAVLNISERLPFTVGNIVMVNNVSLSVNDCEVTVGNSQRYLSDLNSSLKTISDNFFFLVLTTMASLTDPFPEVPEYYQMSEKKMQFRTVHF